MAFTVLMHVCCITATFGRWLHCCLVLAPRHQYARSRSLWHTQQGFFVFSFHSGSASRLKSVITSTPPGVVLWSLWLYVCLSAHMSQATCLDFTKFSVHDHMLPVVMARSSSYDNVLRYVLLFCRWRHVFIIVGKLQIQATGKLFTLTRQVAPLSRAPGRSLLSSIDSLVAAMHLAVLSSAWIAYGKSKEQCFLETKTCRYACLILALRLHAWSWFSQNLPAAWKRRRHTVPGTLYQRTWLSVTCVKVTKKPCCIRYIY